MNSHLKKMLVCYMFFGAFYPVCGAYELNTEQVCKIMRASSERYASLDAEVNERLYHKKENSESIYQQANATVYWKPFVQYCQIDKTIFNVPTEQGLRDSHRIETYSIGTQNSKQLIVMPEKRVVSQGRIMKTTPSIKRKIAVYSAYWTAWPYSFYDWIEITKPLNEITAKYVQENNLYLLERNLTAEENHILYHWELLIDPQKDYLPIKETVNITKNGTSYSQTKEWRDFQKFNGLWLPMKFLWFDEEYQKGGEYTFNVIHVNEFISDEAFRIDFPDGTEVHDSILGIKYRVGTDDRNVLHTNEDIVAAASLTIEPATDQELANAASRAQKLIGEATGEVEKSFEVYPRFIWVEKGLKDYTISIENGFLENDALKSNFLERGGFILHDINNQLNPKGKIIVSIERPDSLTMYSEGKLELELNGQKAIIQLIAFPIPN